MTIRLIVCFDGTWNRPDNNPDLTARVETNVCRFYEAIRNGKLPEGDLQQKWYDSGVGTNWYDRIAGGTFGIGIDQKIRDGYQWLAKNYPNATHPMSRSSYSGSAGVHILRAASLG